MVAPPLRALEESGNLVHDLQIYIHFSVERNTFEKHLHGF